MGRRLRLLGLAAVAVIAVVLFAVFGLASDEPPHGRAAPPLPTQQLIGSSMTVKQLMAGARGRPSLVLFWASWCDPCQQEAAAIERFSRGAVGHDRIVGVDWSDGLSGARSFIAHNGWTFPNLRDAEGTVGSEYHLVGLPTTFVLDGQGRIRQTLRGPQTVSSLGRALSSVEAL